jgi:DNA-directed RNA polymerase specialized sigma24 family protein
MTKRAAIWALHYIGKSYSEIANLEAIPKSTIASIIARCRQRTSEKRFKSAIRSGAPRKLDS